MYAFFNGARLYYDIISDGFTVRRGRRVEKPPCIALHGGPGMDHWCIKPALAGLSGTLQLILPDQRGSGLSDRVAPNSLSMNVLADDIESLRKHLGLSRVVLLGISFGGMLALHYALRYPRALSALILTVTAPSHRFRDDARQYVATLSDRTLRRYAEQVLDGKVQNDEAFRRAILNLMPLYARRFDARRTRADLADTKVNAAVLRWFFCDASRHYDLVSRLDKIRAPTLIVAGEEDWICPLNQSKIMHQRIPNSELLVIKGGRHMCFAEDNARFVNTVKRFLLRRAPNCNT